MTHFWQLPVYGSAIGLAKSLNENTHKVPRWAQARNIDPLKAEVTKILVGIGKASHKGKVDIEERKKWLKDAIDRLEDAKYEVRVLKDCHYLTPEGMGCIAGHISSTLVQLIGWAKSCGMDMSEYDPVDINPQRKSKHKTDVMASGSTVTPD